jgi:hypothetical protein
MSTSEAQQEWGDYQMRNLEKTLTFQIDGWKFLQRIGEYSGKN